MASSTANFWLWSVCAGPGRQGELRNGLARIYHWYYVHMPLGAEQWIHKSHYAEQEAVWRNLWKHIGPLNFPGLQHFLCLWFTTLNLPPGAWCLLQTSTTKDGVGDGYCCFVTQWPKHWWYVQSKLNWIWTQASHMFGECSNNGYTWGKGALSPCVGFSAVNMLLEHLPDQTLQRRQAEELLVCRSQQGLGITQILIQCCQVSDNSVHVHKQPFTWHGKLSNEN